MRRSLSHRGPDRLCLFERCCRLDRHTRRTRHDPSFHVGGGRCVEYWCHWLWCVGGRPGCGGPCHIVDPTDSVCSNGVAGLTGTQGGPVMIRHFTSVVAAALSIGVIGCGVSADDQDVGGGLGETEQASVGDSACTTVSPLVSPDGTSKAIQPDPHCSITFTGATSPDTSYDWSPNACGQTYVAQITGTAGRAFSFGISDAGPALDATTCPLVG